MSDKHGPSLLADSTITDETLQALEVFHEASSNENISLEGINAQVPLQGSPDGEDASEMVGNGMIAPVIIADRSNLNRSNMRITPDPRPTFPRPVTEELSFEHDMVDVEPMPAPKTPNPRIQMMPGYKIDVNFLRLDCSVCFNNDGCGGCCQFPCPRRWTNDQAPVAAVKPWGLEANVFNAHTAKMCFLADGEQTFGKFIWEGPNYRFRIITVDDFLKLKFRVALLKNNGATTYAVSDRIWMTKVGSIDAQILVPTYWSDQLVTINAYERRQQHNDL